MGNFISMFIFNILEKPKIEKVKPKKEEPSKKRSVKNEKIDNWMKCDKCGKWRKISPSNLQLY